MSDSERQKAAAADDPRGIHDGLGASPAPALDHIYEGRGFPKWHEGDPHYLRPELISGTFAVETWLRDHLGVFGAVLADGHGKRWAIFDLDSLVRMP